MENGWICLEILVFRPNSTVHDFGPDTRCAFGVTISPAVEVTLSPNLHSGLYGPTHRTKGNRETRSRTESVMRAKREESGTAPLISPVLFVLGSSAIGFSVFFSRGSNSARDNRTGLFPPVFLKVRRNCRSFNRLWEVFWVPGYGLTGKRRCRWLLHEFGSVGV